MKLYDEGIGYGMSSHHIFPPGSYHLVNEITSDTDMIVLGGGSDIGPELYDNDNVACGGINHRRDAHDLEIYQSARRFDLPILGICRGAQFLNAMNGGSLIQDVSGHLGSHKMLLDPLIDGMDFEMIVSSTHHQMMVPHKSGEVLGYSLVRNQARDRYDTKRIAASQVPKVDPEVVFYPKTRSLCVQFHPEYYGHKHPLPQFVRNLCTLLLGV